MHQKRQKWQQKRDRRPCERAYAPAVARPPLNQDGNRDEGQAIGGRMGVQGDCVSQGQSGEGDGLAALVIRQDQQQEREGTCRHQ